jgi:hypothetical protein
VTLILFLVGNFKIMMIRAYARRRRSRMKHLAHILLPSVVRTAWFSEGKRFNNQLRK